VVSPSGRWLAWTCIDAITELELAQETIVRVSPLGLDRFTGVPMTPLAIDDEGHLLLTSEPNVVTDPIDGTTPEAVPRNLYVLSREGVLGRIDELEPEPIQVDTEDQFGAYLQARAI
jgi:hypothetical protein